MRQRETHKERDSQTDRKRQPQTGRETEKDSKAELLIQIIHSSKWTLSMWPEKMSGFN